MRNGSFRLVLQLMHHLLHTKSERAYVVETVRMDDFKLEGGGGGFFKKGFFLTFGAKKKILKKKI